MKILKKALQREYELTFLLPHSLTSEEVKKKDQVIIDLAKKHSVEIASQQDWGALDLNYSILQASVKHTKAIYKHWVLSSDPANIVLLENDLRLNQNILRFLLVKATAEESSFGQSQNPRLPQSEKTDVRSGAKTVSNTHTNRSTKSSRNKVVRSAEADSDLKKSSIDSEENNSED